MAAIYSDCSTREIITNNKQEHDSTYHEDAVRPPVGGGAVALAIDDLRCHVLHRPTERERLLLVKYRLLAQTKVRQLYVTVGIQ